jgi:hypothetical protein
VRDISTVTVAIRFGDLEEIKNRIRELRQSIMHMMSDSGDPDCVYQINFQAIPLSMVEGLERRGEAAAGETTGTDPDGKGGKAPGTAVSGHADGAGPGKPSGTSPRKRGGGA